MKNGTSLRILSILAIFLRLPSRGLAGVLPPAGQSFEKWHLLENFVNLGEFVHAFSRGGARFAAVAAPVAATPARDYEPGPIAKVNAPLQKVASSSA